MFFVVSKKGFNISNDQNSEQSPILQELLEAIESKDKLILEFLEKIE